MINVRDLKKGDLVKCIEDAYNGIKNGDILSVTKTGYSSWDGYHYADAVTEDERRIPIEIMKNYRNFERI